MTAADETIERVVPLHPLSEAQALDWLRSQPAGRVTATNAELGRRWDWPQESLQPVPAYPRPHELSRAYSHRRCCQDRRFLLNLLWIPFAWAHLKLVGLALWPIGRWLYRWMPSGSATRRPGAEAFSRELVGNVDCPSHRVSRHGL